MRRSRNNKGPRASSEVKWWDQETWTEKEWKPYNKRAEKLRALNAEVKKTNANACWPSKVTYENLMKRLGSIDPKAFKKKRRKKECSREGCATPAHAHGKCYVHGKEDGDIVVPECSRGGCAPLVHAYGKC